MRPPSAAGGPPRCATPASAVSRPAGARRSSVSPPAASARAWPIQSSRSIRPLKRRRRLTQATFAGREGGDLVEVVDAELVQGPLDAGADAADPLEVVGLALRRRASASGGGLLGPAARLGGVASATAALAAPAAGAGAAAPVCSSATVASRRSISARWPARLLARLLELALEPGGARPELGIAGRRRAARPRAAPARSRPCPRPRRRAARAAGRARSRRCRAARRHARLELSCSSCSLAPRISQPTAKPSAAATIRNTTICKKRPNVRLPVWLPRSARREPAGSAGDILWDHRHGVKKHARAVTPAAPTRAPRGTGTRGRP